MQSFFSLSSGRRGAPLRVQVAQSQDGGASEWLATALSDKRKLEAKLAQERAAHAETKKAVGAVQQEVG